MGFNICGAGTGSNQDHRRPCRSYGICDPDGKFQSLLWKIRRQDGSGQIYDRQQHSLHYFLSLHFPCTICICVTDRLFHLRIFRGNHVAGKLQQGIHGTAKRRYIPVCASCTGRRCRMLRRSDFSWICVRDIIRQPEKRNPGRGYFPCIFAGGNSAFGKEPECRVK